MRCVAPLRLPPSSPSPFPPSALHHGFQSSANLAQMMLFYFTRHVQLVKIEQLCVFGHWLSSKRFYALPIFALRCRSFCCILDASALSDCRGCKSWRAFSPQNSPPPPFSSFPASRYCLGNISTSGTLWGLFPHLTSRKQKAPSLTLAA